MYIFTVVTIYIHTCIYIYSYVNMYMLYIYSDIYMYRYICIYNVGAHSDSLFAAAWRRLRAVTHFDHDWERALRNGRVQQQQRQQRFRGSIEAQRQQRPSTSRSTAARRRSSDSSAELWNRWLN